MTPAPKVEKRGWPYRSLGLREARKGWNHGRRVQWDAFERSIRLLSFLYILPWHDEIRHCEVQLHLWPVDLQLIGIGRLTNGCDAAGFWIGLGVLGLRVRGGRGGYWR